MGAYLWLVLVSVVPVMIAVRAIRLQHGLARLPGTEQPMLRPKWDWHLFTCSGFYVWLCCSCFRTLIQTCEAEKWHGGASNPLQKSCLLHVQLHWTCSVYMFLQINQTRLLEHLVHQTYGVPPSLFHGTAPLTMVEARCSPTLWRSGTQWITNGQTSLPAAARLSTCRTCRLTGSTNSVCELLTCTASASPVRNLRW